MQFDYRGQKAYDIMEKGDESLFLTGKAGTGKSSLVKHFLATTEKEVLIVAPTGVAAINVDGLTIHSFFQFHPGITYDEVYGGDHFLNPQRLKVVRNLDTIIIDEISMVRADMLDCIDKCLRVAIKSNAPFGGVQIIFVGDLYQLPPIVRREEEDFFREQYQSPFFFSSHAYEELDPKVIELQHIYRQEDENFKYVLNKMRLGLQSQEDLDIVNTRVGKEPSSTLQAISLMTTNKDVADYNRMKLNMLDEEEFVCFADISGEVPPAYFMNDMELRVKRGAQIMMLVNGKKYVNGSIGTLVSYDEEEEEAVVEIDGEEIGIQKHEWNIRKPVYDNRTGAIGHEDVGSFMQMPFKLARALTIHKAQGLTFHHVRIDLGRRVFALGQSYVALSRATSLEGMYLSRAITMSDVRIDKRIMRYMGSALEKQKEELISEAIDQRKTICFHYVGSVQETSIKRVLPKRLESIAYKGKQFLGCHAYCEELCDDKVFYLARMFELEIGAC